VKIADFGVACALEARPDELGMAIGTPGYMALEQAPARPVDARTDLYSIGVIAFELISGRLPPGRRPAGASRSPDRPSSGAPRPERLTEAVADDLRE
jgi:serine/threonine protein kinase